MNDYQRIAKAIQYITDKQHEQPNLDEIAASIHLSPYHFQRLFSRWAGISPKRFLQALTVNHAKQLLEESCSILDATNKLELSSSARLYDHFVTLEAMTPGEYQSKGNKLTITYGVHETPFGTALIATTQRGICHLSFIDNDEIKPAIQELKNRWAAANFHHSNKNTESLTKSIFYKTDKHDKPLSLHVKGTNFQINVWRALLKIQTGQLCNYGQLAKALDKPHAARAVGQAVGANPVAYVIPCHRVINATGVIGNYRWGKIRKQAMLCREIDVA